VRSPRWRIVGGIIGVWVFLLLLYIVAYFLTSFVFQRFDLAPAPLLGQLINAALTFVLFFLVAAGLSFRAQKRGWGRQRGPLGPIIDAMERIAKGDFSVHVEDQFQENEPFGQLVESVNTMAMELNEMEKMRQEFISNVSHEIQSPLTSIRGFAQALQNERLDPEEREHYLKVIEEESTRLSRITENLLKLASLESDHVRFEPKPYRLDRQVRNLILASEPQWEGKQIEMDVSLDEVYITADEDLLSQVWNNLIHNSIKFTPPGGKISVSLSQQDGRVCFAIRDTGVGISVEDQTRIFERFYKADKSRTRSKEGSGLGLSIAQKIIAMHKGTIQVESRPGEGATFTVELPGEPAQ
jgi:two-component system phosphate regulon sensor histidine kinase PhoR